MSGGHSLLLITLPKFLEDCLLSQIAMLDIIIDTDPGVDDAVAIALAFLSPEIKIHAITLTYGNTTLENTARNLVTILYACYNHFKCESFGSSKSYEPMLVSLGILV